MKWPSRSAPLERNTASVRSAISRRAASWSGRRRVVMAGRFYPRAADRPSVAVGDGNVMSSGAPFEPGPDLGLDPGLLLPGADPQVDVPVRPAGIGGVGRQVDARAPGLGDPAVGEGLTPRVPDVLVVHQRVERVPERVPDVEVRDPADLAREAGEQLDLVAAQDRSAAAERAPGPLLRPDQAGARFVVKPRVRSVVAQVPAWRLLRDRRREPEPGGIGRRDGLRVVGKPSMTVVGERDAE